MERAMIDDDEAVRRFTARFPVRAAALADTPADLRHEARLHHLVTTDPAAAAEFARHLGLPSPPTTQDAAVERLLRNLSFMREAFAPTDPRLRDFDPTGLAPN
jgi:hypothetical protein